MLTRQPAMQAKECGHTQMGGPSKQTHVATHKWWAIKANTCDHTQMGGPSKQTHVATNKWVKHQELVFLVT